jgi:alpha-beta hydrolase superfamily lysophospholipase
MLVPGDDQVADASASVAFFNRSGSGDKTIKHYPDHRHELLRELGRLFIYTDIVAWVEARIATTNAPTPAAIA